MDPGGGCATSLKMTTGGSSSGCGRGGRGYRRDAGGVGSRTWQQLGQGNEAAVEELPRDEAAGMDGTGHGASRRGGGTTAGRDEAGREDEAKKELQGGG